MMLQFLKADNINSFSTGITFDSLGSPPYFQYDVIQQGDGLFFQATNTIPAPRYYYAVQHQIYAYRLAEKTQNPINSLIGLRVYTATAHKISQYQIFFTDFA
jgi:hypothetical protein